jgi:serine/threonine protein kinase
MADEHLISLQPGTVIGGKYEVVKCLGAGSMGMVYACRHRDLQGQLVAAKVLFHEVASDGVAAARFKNEVLASYGVSHPNVVRAYEYIKDGELIAYTMEFVGGGDLADRMSRTEPLRIVESLRLLSQMAAGVQAIHDAGIVHRDLKPENILLTNEGTVKIADFGIARTQNGPKLTEHGGVVGTLEYVAPEYMLRSQVDWRSDIYALGILAYELIAGDAPFKGESAYASISKRLQTDPEPPSALRPECPKSLDAVILRALHRDPELRYQSATEMFYDLQRVAIELGVSEANGSGILIPPESATQGKKYIGPSLSSPNQGVKQSPETNLLTSDGSIEYTPPSAARSEGWQRSDAAGGAVRAPSRRTKDLEENLERSDTQVLEGLYRQAHEHEAAAEHTRYSAQQPAAIHSSPDPLVSNGPVRYEPRNQRARRASTQEFPAGLVERNNRRMRLLDMAILGVAALCGVAFGYVFLRFFAPSFLQQLNLLGM